MTIKSTPIETREQAAAIIEAVSSWLHAHKRATPTLRAFDKNSADYLAREWAAELLEGVPVNDNGGCPLCMG